MSIKRSRILLLGVAALLLGVLGVSIWAFSAIAPPPASHLTVTNGSSLGQVARQLEQQGIIRTSYALRLLARLKNQETAISAGTYSFTQKASPAEILERLVAGDVDLIQLTIPEGFNLRQIAARLAGKGIADQDILLAEAQNAQFIALLGINARSLEGYLFPETYRFVPGITERELLKMMVRQYRSRTKELFDAVPGQVKLSEHELVTMASIIQKETGRDDEMPLISSVFHNRLKHGIPLQTDPTVIYGIKDFDGNLTRRDLQHRTDYNTYLIPGLPPGPIASPGLKALTAAAHPASTKYLYFVARGDGSHQFSLTLKEHNRAVRKYQLRR